MSDAEANPGEITCPEEIYSNYTRHFMYIEKNRIAFDYATFSLGIIGCILHLIILIVFRVKKLITRFERILSIYSFASFIILAMYALSRIVNFNFYTTVGFYMRVLSHSALYITISYSSIIDTYIIYERIQLYKPHMKFMFKISLVKLSIFFLVLAVIANIPQITLILNRYRYQLIDNNCNVTTQIQSYSFESHTYRIICFIILGLQYSFSKFVDLILTIYLLRIFRHFYRNKNGLNNSVCAKMTNRTKERNNTIIAVVLCLVSTFLSLITLMDKVFNIQIELLTIRTGLTIFHVGEILIIIKYSINFFLFYFLNRKFRKCVNRVFQVFACCRR